MMGLKLIHVSKMVPVAITDKTQRDMNQLIAYETNVYLSFISKYNC